MITETVVFSLAAFIGNLGVAITGKFESEVRFESLRSKPSLNLNWQQCINPLFAEYFKHSCFPIPFDAIILVHHNTYISFH